MTDFKPLVVALAVLLAVAVLGMGVGGAMIGPGMMWPGMMPGYGSSSDVPALSWSWGVGMAVGWLVMLAFSSALLVGIAMVIRWLVSASQASGPSHGEEALAILRRRYAAGEIDELTYQRMKREIQEDAA